MSISNVVIVGGGFAGVTVARRLERRLPEKFRLILISEENFITFNPLLAEVVSASILPGQVVAPIRQVLRRTRLYMAVVTDVDLERREIHYRGEDVGVLRYDHLVLACGTTVNLGLFPGMAAHALPLKTSGDALFIRNRVLTRMEQAEMQSDPERRRWLCTFIVVGGGLSGVEVAGAIGDFLRALLRYYPKVDQRDCRVILLHNLDRILPELPADLAEFALKKMRKHGIDVRLKTPVVRVDDQGVELQSGERINGGTTICTIGSAPTELVEQLPLAKQRGRIKTAPDMSVPGHPGVWALGDCAAVVNARDGQLCPPTAQFATRQAEQLARNLLRDLRGKPTRPFCYKSSGQLSSCGHQKAVAAILGVHFSGFVAWLMLRGVYLLRMPTISRKVRLFFEWTWSWVFPRDIVHLSFSRTRSHRDAA